MMGLAFWVMIVTGSAVNPWTHNNAWIFQIGETQADCEAAAKASIAKGHKAACFPVYADQLDRQWFPPALLPRKAQ